MGACAFCRIVLSVLLIALNAVGFVVGVVLMSLAAWQWTGYVGSEAFFDRIFGNSREVLLFFLSAGVAVAVLAVIGILAGVASLFARLRYLAGELASFPPIDMYTFSHLPSSSHAPAALHRSSVRHLHSAGDHSLSGLQPVLRFQGPGFHQHLPSFQGPASRRRPRLQL